MASDINTIPDDNPHLAAEFDEADPSVAVDLDDGVEDEADEASNDLADDALLAAGETPQNDEDGQEETGAPPPAEVDEDDLDGDDVIDPEGDIGNFASSEGGRAQR